MNERHFPWQYILIVGLTVVFTVLGLRVGILWDNVLFVSKTGTFLYEHGLLSWFDMPVRVHSAHPYLCGTYYAAMWHLFGRSLLVSHLVTIPIIIGVLYQLWQLCCFFLEEEKQRYAALLLMCANPTLCSHCVQAGQELFILFFTLYALNAILRQEQLHKAIALCFLPLFSLRAMMLCAGLFFTEWGVCAIRKERFWTIQRIGTYAGGLILSVSYLFMRYAVFSGEPTKVGIDYFSYTSMAQILYTFARNIVILVWRFIDFGQVTVFIVIGLLLLRHKETLRESKVRLLLLCAIMPTGVIGLTSIFSMNPMGHHYFLPAFVICIFLAFYLLRYARKRKLVYGLLLCSLLAGNLIVYPEYLSQGWNNSLAHLPYWSIRRQAIHEMNERHIPLEQTASFFPNACANDLVELNGDQRSFCAFTGKEEYVFYSSCYNPLDEEIDILHTQYNPLFTYRRGLVFVQVLQRADSIP